MSETVEASPQQDEVPLALFLYRDSGQITQCVLPPVHPSYPETAASAGLRSVVVPASIVMGRDASSVMDVGAFYIFEDQLLPRPSLASALDKAAFTADGMDSATVSGLPDPCVVQIDGEPHSIEGGTLTLRSETPAAYHISVDHWPYLPWTITVTAEAP